MDNYITCSNCGCMISGDYAFCPQCGFRVEQQPVQLNYQQPVYQNYGQNAYAHYQQMNYQYSGVYTNAWTKPKKMLTEKIIKDKNIGNGLSNVMWLSGGACFFFAIAFVLFFDEPEISPIFIVFGLIFVPFIIKGVIKIISVQKRPYKILKTSCKDLSVEDDGESTVFLLRFNNPYNSECDILVSADIETVKHTAKGDEYYFVMYDPGNLGMIYFPERDWVLSPELQSRLIIF